MYIPPPRQARRGLSAACATSVVGAVLTCHSWQRAGPGGIRRGTRSGLRAFDSRRPQLGRARRVVLVLPYAFAFVLLNCRSCGRPCCFCSLPRHSGAGEIRPARAGALRCASWRLISPTTVSLTLACERPNPPVHRARNGRAGSATPRPDRDGCFHDERASRRASAPATQRSCRAQWPQAAARLRNRRKGAAL